MTLEDALRIIIAQDGLAALRNKPKTVSMLEDLLPGDGELRRIKNRVKWAYDLGAIKALADTPDHELGRKKAISIMQAGSDLQEDAIVATIEAFCVALGWKNTTPAPPAKTIPAKTPTVAPSVTPARTLPTKKPVVPPAPKPQTYRSQSPHQISMPGAQGEGGAIQPAKAFSGNTGSAVASHTGNVPRSKIVLDVEDLIEGRTPITVKPPRISGKWDTWIHIAVQVMFLLFVYPLALLLLPIPGRIAYTVGVLVFFVWECVSFGRNVTVRCSTGVRNLVGILCGGIMAAIFVLPGFGDVDVFEFCNFLRNLFWPAMIAGNLGRILRRFLRQRL